MTEVVGPREALPRCDFLRDQAVSLGEPLVHLNPRLPTEGAEPRGVQIAVAQVQARILQPAIVRQATGPDQADRRAPAPQISRRGRTVLVEYQ